MTVKSMMKIATLVQERDTLNDRISSEFDRLFPQKGINPKPRKVAKLKKANGKNGVSAKKRLMGKYMGIVRDLPLAQKRAVSKTRESKGYHAAIRQAKEFRAQEEA
jgi:hypothetical protein